MPTIQTSLNTKAYSMTYIRSVSEDATFREVLPKDEAPGVGWALIEGGHSTEHGNPDVGTKVFD